MIHKKINGILWIYRSECDVDAQLNIKIARLYEWKQIVTVVYTYVILFIIIVNHIELICWDTVMYHSKTAFSTVKFVHP